MKGGDKMFFMQIIKHAPETCPVYEPKYRKHAIDFCENVESIAAKHGVKLVGAWNDHPGHILWLVYEAPGMDAIMGLMMEPLLTAGFAFNTVEFKPVFTLKETLDLIKKAP